MRRSLDSTVDLRTPGVRDKMKASIARVLTKKPQTTRAIAAAAKCNMQQARLLLDELYFDKKAAYQGDRRTRTWSKP